MTNSLLVAATEIEVAEALSLVVSMYGSASSVAQTIRRLAYQRDILLQERDLLHDAIHDVNAGKCTVTELQDTVDRLRE